MKKTILLFLIPFIFVSSLFVSCKQEETPIEEEPVKYLFDEFRGTGTWVNKINKNFQEGCPVSKIIFDKDNYKVVKSNGEDVVLDYEIFHEENIYKVGSRYVYDTNLPSGCSVYDIKQYFGVLVFFNDKNLTDKYLFEKSSSAGSDDPSDNSNDIKGSYNFNSASGYQKNGTVSLNDGNWSYSGEKTNAAATSGTYTVNGNKVTVNWVASGMDLSETFTVTTDGSSSTWVSDESGASPFLVMLFGTTDTQITFSYSE